MTPTWYDLLGVEPDASADDIRAAWKAAIADLDPTDRRFKTLNEAAEVLLDPQRRPSTTPAWCRMKTLELTGQGKPKRNWKRQTRRNRTKTREPHRA